MERHGDRAARSARSEAPPLTSILTLNPCSFPEELFTNRQQTWVGVGLGVCLRGLGGCGCGGEWTRVGLGRVWEGWGAACIGGWKEDEG